MAWFRYCFIEVLMCVPGIVQFMYNGHVYFVHDKRLGDNLAEKQYVIGSRLSDVIIWRNL